MYMFNKETILTAFIITLKVFWRSNTLIDYIFKYYFAEILRIKNIWVYILRYTQKVLAFPFFRIEKEKDKRRRKTKILEIETIK